jgi:uncharacterized protein
MIKKILVQATLMLPLVFTTTLTQAKPPASCPPEAKELTPSQIETGLRDARDRGFLWRITKNAQTSYLYGTLHIAKRDWAAPGPKIMQAIKSSDTVALELDLQDPTLLKAMQIQLATLQRHELPTPLQQKLKNQLEQACMPTSLVEALTPEMITYSLIAAAARTEGLYPQYGIDKIHGGMAHRMQKKVVSLETPELQLKLLHGQNASETTAMVEQTLSDLENPGLKKMLLRMSDMWEKSRLDELNSYQSWCECVKTPLEQAQLKRMLDDRNPALAEKIDTLHISGKRVFAAVGALHMTGAMGLPKLMVEQGYKVERVDFKAK